MIEQEVLKGLLRYDEADGNFYWIGGRVGITDGKKAGSVTPRGYRTVLVLGKRYFCHRLAFLYVTGEWPSAAIDHINGDRDDNRWANLRAVSRSINNQNQRKARSDSSTGLLGASPTRSGNRFKAQIQLGGKSWHLGQFATAMEAHLAYVAAKRIYHPGVKL